MSDDENSGVAPRPRAVRKVQTRGSAGRDLSNAHAERMANFVLKDEPVVPAGDAQGHCRDCQMQPMMSWPYVGGCTFCPPPAASSGDGAPVMRDSILSYQCMCVDCAVRLKRCCGCGNRVA